MELRVTKTVNEHTWKVSLLLSACFLLLFHLFCYPLYNSGDDAFFAYTVGGGYGEAPTNLLHYNHVWHFWLGSVTRELFRWFPGVNMYSLLLLFFHLTGCSAVAYVLFKRLRPGPAIFFILSLFFFIESRLLLSLTFTGTSFVLAAGGAGLLVHQVKENKIKGGNALLAIALMILAGLLRLHVSVLVMILFFPVVITMLNRKALVQCVAVFIVTSVVLFLLNKLHEEYYRKNIPGWTQQEELRQALFFIYNRPLKKEIPPGGFTDSAERRLFFTGFLYDSAGFSTEKIKILSKKVVRKRLLDYKEDRQGLYWFFIEMRIYALLFFIVLLALYLRKSTVVIRKWLLSFAGVMCVYAYLFIFLKVPLNVHCGLLFILWQQLAMQVTKEDEILKPVRSRIPVFPVFFFALVIWMGIRLFKQDRANRTNHEKFLCAVNEINRHPDQLFIATADIFPLEHMSTWDVPAKFTAANLIYKDRMLTNMHLSTMERFGIRNLDKAARTDTNLLFIGPYLPSLEKTTDRVTVTMGCLQVRKLNAVSFFPE